MYDSKPKHHLKPGLLITPSYVGGDPCEIHFDIWMVDGALKKSKDEIFLTSNRIKEILLKYPLSFSDLHGHKQPLGRIIFDVRSMKKQITTLHYFPFDSVVVRDRWKRLGIASLIEMRIERYLLKHYPGYTIQSAHPMYTLGPRQHQLTSRGRKLAFQFHYTKQPH